MNAVFIETLPQAVVAASNRLPKRLIVHADNAPIILVSLDRGQELANFVTPMHLALVVTGGRVAVTHSVISMKLTRFDSFSLSSGLNWNVRALEASDFLLIDQSLDSTARKRLVSEFFGEAAPAKPKRLRCQQVTVFRSELATRLTVEETGFARFDVALVQMAS